MLFYQGLRGDTGPPGPTGQNGADEKGYQVRTETPQLISPSL